MEERVCRGVNGLKGGEEGGVSRLEWSDGERGGVRGLKEGDEGGGVRGLKDGEGGGVRGL